MSKLKVVLILFIWAAFLSVSNQAQTVSLVKDFEGIQWNEKKPPDPDIAAGPNHIVLTVNNGIQIYTKDGAKLSENTLRSWFSSLGISEDPVDPKIVFNNYCDRWIVFAITRSSGFYLLSVSKTDDPMGEWYHYKFDALEREDGGYIYPPDYTGLGYNSEAIYITSNHLNDYVPTHEFQWAKIKAIKLSDLINGVGSPKSKDFTKMRNEDQSSAKNIKPVDYQFGSSTDFYLINTGSNYGDFINIWKISDPFGTNSSITCRKIIVGAYSSPNDAPQPGGTRLIETNDTRISDCTYNNGFIYGCFHSKNSFNNGSAVRYFKLRVSDYSLLINDVIEQNGMYYYYPEIYPDKYGNIVCLFNKSSTSNYVGLAWTYRLSDATATGPINWLQQGQGYYDRLNDEVNRWGDYNGICLDPVERNRIWFAGEYAKSGNIWGTKVGAVEFNDIPEQTTFTNMIGNENAGGSFTVEGIPGPIPSGQSISLIQDRNYTVSANNERFSNWMNSGLTYKHHDWNFYNYEYLLKHSFIAGEVGTEIQKAKFLNLTHSTLNVLVDGQLINGKGICEFHDPWFIMDNNTQPGNYWKEFTSNYEPNGKEGATEKGVFLGQRPTQGKYYSVRALLMQNPDFGGSIGIRNCYFQNWDYSGAEILQADVNPSGYDQKAVVFNSEDATVKAKYKASMLSNTQTAFSNSSQRKFIRTSEGYLHLVYESMGRVWYEMSTDNGVNWRLMNGGKPLGSLPSKLPSIASYGSALAIVWQENNSSSSNIRIKIFYYVSGDYIPDPIDGVVSSTILSYSTDINPSVAWGNNARIIVIWENKDIISGSLRYKYGITNGQTLSWLGEGDIPGSSGSSGHPTVSADIDPSSFNYFNIAWEEGVSPYTSILYNRLHIGSNGLPDNTSNTINLSAPYSFNQNSCPSVVSIPGGRSRLVWKAYRIYDPEDPSMFDSRVAYLNPDDPLHATFISKYSGDVFSPQVNSFNDSYSTGSYMVAWTDFDGTGCFNVASESNNFRYMETLRLAAGRSMQMNNGGTKDNMYLMAFEGSSFPYVFRQSQAIGTIQWNKTKSFMEGRIASIKKSNAHFFFTLGDVSAENIPVSFMDVKDSLKIKNMKDLNRYLQTEPFMLKDNSEFLFSVRYGVMDSIKASHDLKEGEKVSFRVELIDAEKDSVIGLYTDVNIDKTSLISLKEYIVKVNTSGMKSRLVRLRFSVESNFQAGFALADQFTGKTMLLKGHAVTKEMDLQGSLKVDSYSIFQNYPNPFNPSTTISYQIPKASKVTLKIYDILGKEVAVLVNGYKEMGRYSVQFNASKLPSGTYIYEIRANDFVKSGKMMLLK